MPVNVAKVTAYFEKKGWYVDRIVLYHHTKETRICHDYRLKHGSCVGCWNNQFCKYGNYAMKTLTDRVYEMFGEPELEVFEY